MTDREYLIALSTFPAFGPVRLKLLLNYFGGAGKIWKAKKSELLKIGVGAGITEKFVIHKEAFNLSEYFRKLDNLKVNAFTVFDSGYPENLKEISDSPMTLYVRGKLEKSDSRSVAIIGSRLMTSYGREIATNFAGALAEYGVTVVSGLALGVDAQAQKSALAAGGRSIAVLASGLDIISPLTNKSLALELLKNRGAVVSEYPLGHVPFRSDFAIRNRLISGIARAVIVIEGRIKSGTFYTVNAAALQGRPVFAVPGQITSPNSEGPNYLIQNGAKLITSVRDVLQELNMEVVVDREKMEKVMPGDSKEEDLLEVLGKESLHLDEIVRISGITTSEVSARLTIMEMKGMVKSIGNGIYRKL